MAWAEKLPSGRWRASYRSPGGRLRSAGTFPHKAAAVRAGAAAEAEARAPRWRDRSDADRVTWAAWCESWWPTRAVEPSTLARDAARRDLHLLPRWGAVPVTGITRHDVRAWAGQLLVTGRSPATVQRIVHLLSASLAAAVDAELLDANPAARLRLRQGQQASERYLSREEYAAITEHMDERDAVVAHLLVGTGLRWGEAAGLHRHRLDTDRGVLRVVETWDTSAGQVKAYPKGRRIRQVPVPRWVLDALPDPGPGRSCGEQHAVGTCRSPLVLTAPRGGALDVDNWRRRAWEPAVRAADVDHVRVHDLRHTYASWLIQDGITLEEVGRLLGHVSPLTTRRYAHLADTPHADVLAALTDPRSARLEPAEAALLHVCSTPTTTDGAATSVPAGQTV